MAAAPNVHRGCFQGSVKSKKLGKAYAKEVEAILENIGMRDREVAAFYCESMVSCGGQYELPSGYLRSVYRSVRAKGGVCIADEVQVGFGRIGDSYWAFEDHRVVPDIVTVGKPMGNGHPIAAVVTSPAIARAFSNGVSYFNTFGGNPVACAAGRAVLRVLREENLMSHALRIGTLLRDNFMSLRKRFPALIGDVRGRGLFVGMELLANRTFDSISTRLALTDMPNDTGSVEFDELVRAVVRGETVLQDECGNDLLIPFKLLADWVSLRYV